ncbi:YegP family protein [Larkinella sp. VNQ87]|uniref:YegP family protein n=1 Tax=Larkinella sp. VNQ87 TaxID=3400921 RepID=UPI003C0196DD
MFFLIEQHPQSGNGYQFRLMKNNRETILVSETFATKVDCLVALDAARRSGVAATNYPLWDLAGNIRFNLFYGADNLLIGTIRYKTVEERDQALQEVVNKIAQVPARDEISSLALAA